MKQSLFKSLLATLARPFQRAKPQSVALPNALGLFNETGIETLLLDNASVYNATNLWPGRYLLVQRGAGGYQYGDLAQGTALPLGPSSDSPAAPSDPFNIRRLGARPGLELGIASGAITVDHLVYATTGGKVADLTLAGNGTYWVVGRAAGTVAAGNSTGEIAYVPDVPYQVTVSGGGGTYTFIAGT